MANYYAVSRTNYFRVKDENAFRDWVAEAGFQIWIGDGQNEGMLALGPNEFSDDGCLDLPYDDEPRDLVDELSQHLTDDTVCVLMESGHEKMRYVTGNAVAFNSKGEFVQVNLNDIYALAKQKFGVAPTACEY